MVKTIEIPFELISCLKCDKELPSFIKALVKEKGSLKNTFQYIEEVTGGGITAVAAKSAYFRAEKKVANATPPEIKKSKKSTPQKQEPSTKSQKELSAHLDREIEKAINKLNKKKQRAKEKNPEYETRESTPERQAYHSVNTISGLFRWIQRELDKSLDKKLPIKKAAKANNEFLNNWVKVSEIIKTKITGG